MTLEQWASVAEIAGVIIVVVTLAYLAVELRQNTDALHSQTRQNLLSDAQASLLAQLENPEIVGSVVKQGKLTETENLKLNAWLVTIMRHAEFAWQQYRSKVIKE